MTAATARRGEDGSVSILVVGLATALLMVAGLLYDGGQILAGRRGSVCGRRQRRTRRRPSPRCRRPA